MNPISQLLQFSDSAFPVGTFSFSNGLETAAHLGIVHDAQSLLQYARSAAAQAAFSDGVAALISHRAALQGDYAAIRDIDCGIMLFKMNDEARLMLMRMGKKLAELGIHLYPDAELLKQWLADINSHVAPGSYPVAQGIVFALAGIGEKDLYASHHYGVVNMIVSAALRCVRVSHYDTQKILLELSSDVDDYFEKASKMTFDDMNAFVPEMDIMASLHEKGTMRMFMS